MDPFSNNRTNNSLIFDLASSSSLVIVYNLFTSFRYKDRPTFFHNLFKDRTNRFVYIFLFGAPATAIIASLSAIHVI